MQAYKVEVYSWGRRVICREFFWASDPNAARLKAEKIVSGCTDGGFTVKGHSVERIG